MKTCPGLSSVVRALLSVVGAVLFILPSIHAQNGGMLGRSITWRPVNSPFTPDAANGAIMGGPGADPNPGTPMFICRASVQGSVVPGKWVQGNCNVPFNGSEQIMRSYEVAYGSARWGAYQGSFYGLAQTGSNSDGSPLYSCRVQYVDASGNNYGNQPGKLVSDGTCHIPFGGGEVVAQLALHLADLVAVPFHQAAGYDQLAGLAGQLMLGHLEDGVDRLLFRLIYERTGIYHQNVSRLRTVGHFRACLIQQAHHDLAIDQVFGAAQAHKANTRPRLQHRIRNTPRAQWHFFC